MKKIWTVSFCEKCPDYGNFVVLGLFSCEEKAVLFAEKEVNNFRLQQNKHYEVWPTPTRTVTRLNGENHTAFKMKDGNTMIEFVVSMQKYASDEDAV